ncbi:Hypothetical protein CINCED_3A007725 [Cinara cedri]|uniref:Uncharacterized protein n=1 Tax=Cinara cedri TaxID=506608 RepID=A0A5E4M6Y7_9HEMI|nr:Hypothetical protein CINCED_3A007725 [Cinara cedri]
MRGEDVSCRDVSGFQTRDASGVSINQAKCAFNKKKNLFTSRSIDITIRKDLIKTYVWSVVLCSSETWTVAKAEENRLLAFEAWCWRRTQGISWREHMTNDEVFAKAKERKMFHEKFEEKKNQINIIAIYPAKIIKPGVKPTFDSGNIEPHFFCNSELGTRYWLRVTLSEHCVQRPNLIGQNRSNIVN